MPWVGDKARRTVGQLLGPVTRQEQRLVLRVDEGGEVELRASTEIGLVALVFSRVRSRVVPSTVLEPSMVT